MAQGCFQGGSSRRAIAHTRPALPKIPSAPLAFPLLGAPQALGKKPTPPHKGVKAWGNTPQRPEEMLSQQASTRPVPRPSQTWPTEAGVNSTPNILVVFIVTRRVHYSP